MACGKLGKLILNNSMLFLCDMQEKFRPSIQYFSQIVEVSSRMLKAAKILEMPVIVTEQYPKGDFRVFVAVRFMKKFHFFFYFFEFFNDVFLLHNCASLFLFEKKNSDFFSFAKFT